MQRFNINWTAKALVKQMERGKVNYDNAVQRKTDFGTDTAGCDAVFASGD